MSTEIKTGILQLEEEDCIIDTLISLTAQNQFRTAWEFLNQNIDPSHIRVYDAGVMLQSLSNEVGDIGILKDDCFLKRRLAADATQIIKLLV